MMSLPRKAGERPLWGGKLLHGKRSNRIVLSSLVVVLVIFFVALWILLLGSLREQSNGKLSSWPFEGGGHTTTRGTSSLMHSSTASVGNGQDALWDGRLELWKPTDCRKLLTEVRQGIHDVEDPNNGQLYGRLTNTSHPFYINIHTKSFDPMRFEVFETGRYYETVLTEVFEEILTNAPANARVIDVGGNIGWFSLLAASLGHHVDVFEANIVNVLRICQSKWLNEWPSAIESDINSRTNLQANKNKRSSINIRNYGVSDCNDTSSKMSLFFGRNPGMGTFINTEEFLSRKIKLREMDSIQMISLDQMAHDLHWFEESKPKIAILKIDVEGFEPPVIAGAKRLLSSGLVENLVMEISGRHNNTDTIQMVRNIVDAGFVLHRVGGHRGPNQVPTDLAKLSSEELPRALVEKHARVARKQANLWWKHKAATGTQ